MGMWTHERDDEKKKLYQRKSSRGRVNEKGKRERSEKVKAKDGIKSLYLFFSLSTVKENDSRLTTMERLKKQEF